MFTKDFWRIALEYAIKSMAQTGLALWGITNTLGDINLTRRSTTALLLSVFLLSLITSIATAKVKGNISE